MIIIHKTQEKVKYNSLDELSTGLYVDREGDIFYYEGGNIVMFFDDGGILTSKEDIIFPVTKSNSKIVIENG